MSPRCRRAYGQNLLNTVRNGTTGAAGTPPPLVSI
jgi:hypothetical protein